MNARATVVAALAVVIAAATLWVVRQDEEPRRAPSGAEAPRIYGAGPAASPAPAVALGGERRREALQVARRWAAAWGDLSGCARRAPAALESVLRDSGGQLRRALQASPPRPPLTAAHRCEIPRLKRVEIHEGAGGGWIAIATRHGDGLRPLRLRLTTTGDGPRVTAIDY